MNDTSGRDEDAEILDRIKRLPPSVGVTLMTAGAFGAVLPGSMGAPLILAGGMVLAPRLFQRLDDVVKDKFPQVRHHGLRMLDRFLDDYERRWGPHPTDEDQSTVRPRDSNS